LQQAYETDKVQIISDQIGVRDTSSLALGRSVSFGTLRVPIPILGCQNLNDPGLPLVALRSTRLRLRVHIRRLDNLIEASDGRIHPSPWNLPFRVQAVRNGPITTTQSLKRDDMQALDISLESTYFYVPADIQLYLKSQTIVIPFKHIQYQSGTLEDPIMTAAAVTSATYTYNMNLDVMGNVERMLVGFRSLACTYAGQRTILTAPNQTPFIQALRLNMSNIDRLKLQPIEVYREVSSYWKQPRMISGDQNNVYILTFGGYDVTYPVGTLYMTRSLLPTIYVTLSVTQYDPRIISREAMMMLYAETWNLYNICHGVGTLMFES